MYDALFRALALVRRDPFRSVDFDPDLHAEHMRRRPSGIRYGIFFTPRSGSSRLTEILHVSRRLGRPSEYFSAELMPRYARACNARALPDYLELLPRLRNSPQAFGFQINYQQLLTCFGSPAAFRAAFPDLRHLWLIREDIVAQAVSSARMVQTGLRHMAAPDAGAVAEADVRFRYRPLRLKERILRLRWMERRTEAYFDRYAIRPLRLSHEELLRQSPGDTVAKVAAFVGVSIDGAARADTTHARVSADRSDAFIARFRAENARWLAPIEAARTPLLDALRTTR